MSEVKFIPTEETDKPGPESEPVTNQLNDTTTALIKVKPEEDITVLDLFGQACNILRYAEERSIVAIEDLTPATDDLTIIAKLKKALEEKKREYLTPLRDHEKTIRDAFDKLLEPILQADKITRSKILEFQTEQERKRAEEERINRLRMEAAEAEMKLNGELTEPVELVEVTPEAPSRVSTESGMAGKRDNWKWEVVDFAVVPDEYKMIDSSQLTAIAKKHHDKKQVPGVRFYNEPILQVRAR